jgi:hypothetical protein
MTSNEEQPIIRAGAFRERQWKKSSGKLAGWDFSAALNDFG